MLKMMKPETFPTNCVGLGAPEMLFWSPQLSQHAHQLSKGPHWMRLRPVFHPRVDQGTVSRIAEPIALTNPVDSQHVCLIFNHLRTQ